MVTTGASDEPCTGDMGRTAGGSITVSGYVDWAYGRRHSVGGAFHPSDDDCVAIPYW